MKSSSNALNKIANSVFDAEVGEFGYPSACRAAYVGSNPTLGLGSPSSKRRFSEAGSSALWGGEEATLLGNAGVVRFHPTIDEAGTPIRENGGIPP